MRETLQNTNGKQFHAVSLSGGKDSTAMLLLMIERDMPINMVLSADTGMEFPEMYEHLAKLDEHLFRERGIHITTLRHPKGFEYLMFDEPKQKPRSLENRARLGIPPYKYTVKGDTYKLEYTDKQFHDTTSAKIGAKNVSLRDDTTRDYYYGNAKTNYITADLSEVNKNAVISGVDNFTTGVKNVSIDLWTAKNNESNILKAAGKNAATVGDTQGAFCVYKNGYIIAAVVIGDNGATSDSYAYIYGGITNERYVKAEDVYYWSVKAVVAGEVTSITFKSDLPADKLEMDLYKVSYDANGYAVNAEKATCKQANGTDFDWIDSFNPDTTKLISTNFGTQSQPAANLKADGETLWVTQQSAKRGFALADDCKAVIVELNQAGDKVDKAVEYSSVAKAIKALDTYVAKTESANFDGRLILTVKDGIVTSVILTDTVNPEKENVVNGVKASLKVSADGKGLTLVTENLDKAASFKVIAKDIRSGNTGVVNTGDIAANTQYTKVLEQTDGTMTYTVELTVGNKTISVSL